MSKKDRRRRKRQGRDQHGIRVSCAQIKLAEHEGHPYLIGLDLPESNGQWLWRRTTIGPLWFPFSTAYPPEKEETGIAPGSEPTFSPHGPHSIEDDSDADDFDFSFVADSLRILVQRTIERKDPEPARRLDDAFEQAESGESDDDAIGFSFTLAFSQLIAWLAGAREIVGSKGAADALDWVRDHLGHEAYQKCIPLSGILQHPMADPNRTMNDLFDETRGDIMSPSIWLISGVVAVSAECDAEWLQQFDLSICQQSD